MNGGNCSTAAIRSQWSCCLLSRILWISFFAFREKKNWLVKGKQSRKGLDFKFRFSVPASQFGSNRRTEVFRIRESSPQFYFTIWEFENSNFNSLVLCLVSQQKYLTLDSSSLPFHSPLLAVAPPPLPAAVFLRVRLPHNVEETEVRFWLSQFFWQSFLQNLINFDPSSVFKFGKCCQICNYIYREKWYAIIC